jgi:hypothetical protein
MMNFQVVSASLFVIVVFILICMRTSLYLPSVHVQYQKQMTSPDFNGLTIRVNTFRRNDLIEGFLKYYTAEKRSKECAFIKEITVIWSDTENTPPLEWEKTYSGVGGGLVKFEIHKKNSLNNRFLPQHEIFTEAVLSIDDDLIIPCDILARNTHSWSSFKNALVGYSPRMHAFDAETGSSRYLRWQHTWWSGIYSIMLTKAAYMHRDYLADFNKIIPKSFQDHVDNVRNCEDIALAYVIAKKTNAAPVWVDGIVYEVAKQNKGGISAAGVSHFDTRSLCLSVLQNMTKDFPWVTGYQKVLPIGWGDFM